MNEDETNVDLLDKPEVNLRHGSNEVTNLNVLVIENDRLTLDCHVQSNPLSKEPLTWLKNGASLPGKTTTKMKTKERTNSSMLLFLFLFRSGAQSSSLTLSNIKRSDEGEYTCLTSNIIGHGQASVHLRVQCKSKRERNESISFQCVIDLLFFVRFRCANCSIE